MLCGRAAILTCGKAVLCGKSVQCGTFVIRRVVNLFYVTSVLCDRVVMLKAVLCDKSMLCDRAVMLKDVLCDKSVLCDSCDTGIC